MTLKEAVLKSLEEIESVTNYLSVYKYIVEKGYYDFGTSKTPSSTISAVLGDFIRNGDTRIKRIKLSGGNYSYYLTKNESSLNIDALSIQMENSNEDKTKIKLGYEERDLHKLLSTYLKSKSIYSKTIYHEQSAYSKDNNQIWTHPDIVGIRFYNFHTKASQNLFRTISHLDTFEISSYEIKKEINTDSELKKAFFQAVSNSSWANFGYLVALEFSDSLYDELERLNQSFGIGAIELNVNPYQSKVIFQADYHELDFKTIDKLCRINREFEKFVEQTEKLMKAEDRYYKSTEKELEEFCDPYFTNDSEMEAYCIAKQIPTK